MGATVVSRPDLVPFAMSKRAFDRVGMPQTGFIEQRAGHRPETMAGHFIPAVAQPSECDVQSILADRALCRVKRRKDELTGTSSRTQLPQEK